MVHHIIDCIKNDGVIYATIIKNLPDNDPKEPLSPVSIDDDGLVTIEYDGEQLQAGSNVSVVDAEGNKLPLPIGEYELEGGLILVVAEEGMAAEIKEPMPVDEAPQEQEMSEPVNNDAATLEAIENAIKSILIKYSADIDLKFEAITKENAELKSKVLELGNQPSAKPIKSQPVQVDLSKMTEWEKRKYFKKNG